MKRDRASTTAEGMAIVRAIETSRSPARRLLDDPVSVRLVRSAQVAMSRFVIDSGLYARFFGVGVIEFILLRERFIDDVLALRLREGLDQVVLLGAGFDTRALRIPGIEGTRVFLVDHPVTQAFVRARFERTLGPLPGHVVFVGVDFETQGLALRLRDAGFDARGRTMFVWQGVTMYLSRSAVDETLAFVAAHAARGSTVIFDYFYEDVLFDPANRFARRIRAVTSAIGEGLSFALARGAVDVFLTSRGFEGVVNVDAFGLRALYFTGGHVRREVADGAAIVFARVRGGHQES
ncbi:SAM-dependent methyltransferase [Deinococcus pimensis]|uniref:SAM-dependent methyltransferase n=1 Tax=Deinococcus pimensis TaxID=309888 RepID=UPI0004B812D0|nr:SAM-dependent methyltransferase [Deinococcus pimensis]